VGYSNRDELSEILDRTTTGAEAETEQVLDGPKILEYQQLVRKVVIAPHIQDYAVRLVLATHPQGELATPQVNQFLRFGASPRAAQALVLAGKVRALLDGRANVSADDIRSVVLPAMRHRCLLNFEGEAEGKGTDEILSNIIETLPADVGVSAA
jgi:MoxR-like ATPase